MKIVLTERQFEKIIIEQNKLSDYYKSGVQNIKNLFNKPKEKKAEYKKKIEDELSQFSPINLAKYLKHLNIVHPDIVLAQGMIESGHFKSNLFLKNNNIFGMKFPRQRNTTALGQRYGQAYYKNWMESAKDYKLWQEARQLQNLSKQEYLNKLDKIYCVPPHCGNQKYAKTVSSLLGRANTLLNSAK